jgi:DNA-directed RNA polymerase specialized sigma24 family protein
MGSSSRHRLRQVMPFGRPLPIDVDCVPNNMSVSASPKFDTTSWTLVRAAAVDPTEESRQALATLCQTYWSPVYAFVRRNGYDREQAQDLTQGFFTQLLEKRFLVDADQQRGKFRSFLLTAVKHFLANEWDREHALKRGGGKVPVSIDVVAAESWYAPSVVAEGTPESLFERRWALSLLERTLARLRAEFVAAGKTSQFDSLSPFLNKDSGDKRYEDLAEQLGLSAGALRMSVHRMRRRYRDLLREEIAHTVSTTDEIDDEIRFLVSTLSA